MGAAYAGESCSYDHNTRLARGARNDRAQNAGCGGRPKERASTLEKLTAGETLPGALAM
jgi:hypothetical protein